MQLLVEKKTCTPVVVTFVTDKICYLKVVMCNTLICLMRVELDVRCNISNIVPMPVIGAGASVPCENTFVSFRIFEGILFVRHV